VSACGNRAKYKMQARSKAILRAGLLAPGTLTSCRMADSVPSTGGPCASSTWHLAVRPLHIGLVLLWGMCAAGCDLSQPGLFLSGPKPNLAQVSLVIDSRPPGAEARVREGPSCRTPCQLELAPMGPFVVDFTLKGHEPQSVEVVLTDVSPTVFPRGVRLDPNPLSVTLTAIPRPSRAQNLTDRE
jgi:PEGA domain